MVFLLSWNKVAGQTWGQLEIVSSVNFPVEKNNTQPRIKNIFQQEGKLSYLDLDTDDVIHLLPNILIGTGKYCRSCKYHDKAVDNAHLTDNG